MKKPNDVFLVGNIAFEVEDLGRLGDVEVGDGASQGDEVVDIETLEFALDKLAY